MVNQLVNQSRAKRIGRYFFLTLLLSLLSVGCGLEENEIQENESDDYGLQANNNDNDAHTFTVTKRTAYGTIRQKNKVIKDLKIELWDDDVWPVGDDYMGYDYTDSNGYFEIHYGGGHWDDCPHEWTCWRPDLFIRVFAKRWKGCGSSASYGYEEVWQSNVRNDRRHDNSHYYYHELPDIDHEDPGARPEDCCNHECSQDNLNSTYCKSVGQIKAFINIAIRSWKVQYPLLNFAVYRISDLLT